RVRSSLPIRHALVSAGRHPELFTLVPHSREDLHGRSPLRDAWEPPPFRPSGACACQPTTHLPSSAAILSRHCSRPVLDISSIGPTGQPCSITVISVLSLSSFRKVTSWRISFGMSGDNPSSTGSIALPSLSEKRWTYTNRFMESIFSYVHVLYMSCPPNSFGARMQTSETPPSRNSIRATGQVKPFGPHHCITSSESVQAFQTRSTGAAITRVTTRSEFLGAEVILACPGAVSGSPAADFVDAAVGSS